MIKLELQSKRIFLVKFTLKNVEETYLLSVMFSKIILRHVKFKTYTKKNIDVRMKLGNLITKDYNVFVSRIYFTSNDGFQNTFFNQHVYQPNLIH